MDEIHLTKKDFKLEWYSGQGAGGQHRNKHQNCCRITHLASGLTVNGTESRSRVDNQSTAFEKLAKMVISWYNSKNEVDVDKSDEVIRNYHGARNEVLDKASGFKQPYKTVVIGGDIADMIDARRKTIELPGEENKWPNTGHLATLDECDPKNFRYSVWRNEDKGSTRDDYFELNLTDWILEREGEVVGVISNGRYKTNYEIIEEW